MQFKSHVLDFVGVFFDSHSSCFLEIQTKHSMAYFKTVTFIGKKRQIIPAVHIELKALVNIPISRLKTAETDLLISPFFYNHAVIVVQVQFFEFPN
jgi:hypothetical protein